MTGREVLKIIDERGVLRTPGFLAVANAARRRGETIWLVGGIVRDAILGATGKDYDMAVKGDAVGLARQVSTALGASLVLLHDDPPTARVVKDGVEYDFAELRSGDIEGDLCARDLSINALAVRCGPHGPEEFLDPTGGLRDIERGSVRVPAFQNLTADPLRTLRVFRFVAQLGFEIDAETLSWVELAAGGLSETAGERILYEMTRLLQSRRSAPALRLALRYGVLLAATPDLANLAPKAHRVFRHIDFLDTWPDGGNDITPTARELIARDPTAGDPVVMKIAALFKDVGSIAAGKSTSERDAKLCESACARWAASNRVARAAAGILRLQDDVARCLERIDAGDDRLRAYAEYTRLAKDLWLAAAFHFYLAAWSLGEERANGAATAAGFLNDLTVVHETIIAPVDASPLLDGNVLMRELGLSPGPEIGRLLDRVREERIAGRVATVEEALDFCRRTPWDEK